MDMQLTMNEEYVRAIGMLQHDDWMEVEISHGLSEIEAQQSGQRGADINLSEKMREDSWGQNELGFAARIGGYRSWETGAFSGNLQSGAFWSNSEASRRLPGIFHPMVWGGQRRHWYIRRSFHPLHQGLTFFLLAPYLAPS